MGWRHRASCAGSLTSTHFDVRRFTFYPSSSETGFIESGHRSLLIVLRFELRRWHVSNRPQQPPHIEPIHPLQCGELHGLERPPWATSSNHLRLVDRDFRFACPRWPLHTPKGGPAHETLVRHSIVPLERPSAQLGRPCDPLKSLCSGRSADTPPDACPFFARRAAPHVPRVSLPAPAAPRSAAASRRRAAGSDALLRAGASSTAHASPAGPRFSPVAAGDS